MLHHQMLRTQLSAQTTTVPAATLMPRRRLTLTKPQRTRLMGMTRRLAVTLTPRLTLTPMKAQQTTRTQKPVVTLRASPKMTPTPMKPQQMTTKARMRMTAWFWKRQTARR